VSIWLTALNRASVAGVVDATFRSRCGSDKDSHGGSSEESELGEHLIKGVVGWL